MRRRLSAVGQWLRVQHAGAPRWFLGFVLLFGGVLVSVLAAAGR